MDPELEILSKEWYKRAKERKNNSYFFLTISIIIIVLGLFTVYNLIAQFIYQSSDNNYSNSVENLDIYSDSIKKINIYSDSIKNTNHSRTFSNDKKGIATEENPKRVYYYVISLLATISIFFYISQVLLRLYKYNMLKADYFLTCSDALKLMSIFKLHDEDRFNSILTILLTDKIALSTPERLEIMSLLSKKDFPPKNL